jgi:parallel beta-helix repeat protein
MNMTSTNSPSGLNTQTGIYVGDTMNATRINIQKNFVRNVGGYGIVITADDAPAVISHDITASGNQIFNCGGGIDALYTEGVTLTQNTIQSTTGTNTKGISVGSGVTDVDVVGNLINDTVGSNIIITSGRALVSGNTVIMTNRATSAYGAIEIQGDNATVSDNTVDLTKVTSNFEGIVLDGGYGNIAESNLIRGDTSSLVGTGIQVSGTSSSVIGNTIGGFSTCINSGGIVGGVIANNSLSVSECTTKINLSGTGITSVIGNAGYNPQGVEKTAFDTKDHLIAENIGSSSSPNNATTMTVQFCPKLITVVIGTGWTSAHTLEIQIDGHLIISTNAPAAKAIYTFQLNPGETFYIQYQTSQATFVVLGQ